MACAGGDEDETCYYYALFAQEIVETPEYFPFLYTENNAFYQADNKIPVKNQNIEDWAQHLHISYSDAEYLVNKSDGQEIKNILKGKKSDDPKLGFIDQSFVNKHRQALKYLVLAKHLEPYMSIVVDTVTEDTGQWNDGAKSVSEIDVPKNTEILRKSWYAEKDKWLKIRYGYQLVRWAHYLREYSDAIDNFDKYVASLGFKNIVYYYALNQKAGAERGLGGLTDAMRDFMQVFMNTKDLKANAYTSITFTTGDIKLEDLLKKAKTDKEKNDIQFLLGYQDFNNPLPSAEKIAKRSPDAVQIKVLMARAMDQLSRKFLPINYIYPYTGPGYDYGSPYSGDFHGKRIPFSVNSKDIKFYNDIKKLSLAQVNNPKVKDKNFWNYTLGYLGFIGNDFNMANKYISRIKETDRLYKEQKLKLQMLVELTKQDKITPAFEERFFRKYEPIFRNSAVNSNDSDCASGTSQFVMDVLANRYMLQRDYAKSFALHNSVDKLEGVYDIRLINAVESLCKKKNKSSFETYLYERLRPYYFSEEKQKYIQYKDFDFTSYFHQLRGLVFLSEGDFDSAIKELTQVKPAALAFFNPTLPGLVFGYNKVECVQCNEADVMGYDYLEVFPEIKDSMNALDVAKALAALDKIANSDSSGAAKANYLIGNFYYNISPYGYYRSKGDFYPENASLQIQFKKYLSFKYFSNEFESDFDIATDYFNRAYTLAKDDELKARIIFALSKIEQAEFYMDNGIHNSDYIYPQSDYTLISGRKNFALLMNYKSTEFFKEVESNCKYFAYYVNSVK